MSHKKQSSFLSKFFTVIFFIVLIYCGYRFIEGRSHISEKRILELLDWGKSTPELSEALAIAQEDNKITNSEFKKLQRIRVRGLLSFEETIESAQKSKRNKSYMKIGLGLIFSICIIFILDLPKLYQKIKSGEGL